MTAKVLVADDSSTIQKVIGITLSGEDYELSKCLNEEELFTSLEEQDFDLILLDFSLSTEKTGYELSKEILSKSSNTKILALLGTFDSVDDSALSESGVADKIVKPFESDKFIEKCKSVLNGEEGDFSSESSDEDEGWELDSPQVEDKPLVNEQVSTQSAENRLNNEIEGWGMDVPGVIGEGQSTYSYFPPVIDGVSEQATTNGEMSLNDEVADNPTSNLVSLDELNIDEEDLEIDTEESTDLIMTDTIVNEQLQQSVDEEMTSEEFWAVDEGEDVNLNESVTLSSDNATEEINLDSMTLDEQSASDTNVEELKTKLEEQLSPVIEKLVKEICEKQIEKVAWEVIPDLAENLIKKEIKEISSSIEH